MQLPVDVASIAPSSMRIARAYRRAIRRRRPAHAVDGLRYGLPARIWCGADCDP